MDFSLIVKFTYKIEGGGNQSKSQSWKPWWRLNFIFLWETTSLLLSLILSGRWSDPLQTRQISSLGIMRQSLNPNTFIHPGMTNNPLCPKAAFWVTAVVWLGLMVLDQSSHLDDFSAFLQLVWIIIVVVILFIKLMCHPHPTVKWKMYVIWVLPWLWLFLLFLKVVPSHYTQLWGQLHFSHYFGYSAGCS